VSDNPQDRLNRFVIVVLALAGIFAALVVALLAWGAPDESIVRVADLARWLDRHNSTESRTIVALSSAVVALLLLTAIVVEFTPAPARKMRLRNVRAGEAVITTHEIAVRINAQVAAAPHVAACDAFVAAHRGRVEVTLDLHVEPGADLALTADDACGRTRALLESELGVELAAPPRARLHYRELRLLGAADAPRKLGPSGWERPAANPEGDRDQRGNSDTPEKAQA
jgi:hypothetical protein